LLGAYAALTASDLQAVWEHAATHADEIDRAVPGNEVEEDGPVA
jgi:hypothetical protein